MAVRMKNNRWKYKRTNRDFFADLRNFIVEQVQDIKEVNEQISVLDQLSENPDFDRLANEAARRMVVQTSVDNARTWREAAKKSMRGRFVYQALRSELRNKNAFQNLIDQSALNIKTLPRHVAARIVKRVGMLTMQGRRSSEIAQIIAKELMPYAKASSLLIARTQYSKTLTAINETRSTSVGIKAYVWHSVGGPRVRDSHKFMDDVICFWSEPPCPEQLAKIPMKEYSFYHPGGIYNCRRYSEPILSVDDVTWPHRVHYKGKITRMSRKTFTSLIN